MNASEQILRSLFELLSAKGIITREECDSITRTIFFGGNVKHTLMAIESVIHGVNPTPDK